MGQRHKLRRGIVTALLPVCLMATAAAADDVKIGVVLTYSGGAASFGEQIDRGMNLYLKQHPEADQDDRRRADGSHLSGRPCP